MPLLAHAQLSMKMRMHYDAVTHAHANADRDARAHYDVARRAHATSDEDARAHYDVAPRATTDEAVHAHCNPAGHTHTQLHTLRCSTELLLVV